MNPILFQIRLAGNIVVTIPAFGVLLLIAIVLSAVLGYFRIRRLGADPLGWIAVMGFGVGFGMAGAMAAGLLFSQFDHSVQVRDFTLAWQGGLLFGVLGAVWMLRNLRYPVLASLDALMPALFVGLAVGRLGCLLAGCCYGRPTSLPWGITYPSAHAGHALYGDFALHPTPVYSVIIAIGIAVVAHLMRARVREGVVFVFSLVAYSAARGFIEWTRGDHGDAMGALTLQQLLSMVMIAALALWYRWHRARQLPGVSSRVSDSPRENER